MFYAVLLCGNPNHPSYLKPIEFMLTTEGDLDDVTLATETEEEMEEKLKDHPLYKAGWVDIVEIG